MAAPVCQFVDRVGSGAVQRLNLNDGKRLRLLTGPDFPGPDFSPPPLKRAVVNTLLVEGASIPASAYDNRVIRLPLRVKACDEEEMATILESLHRELDRANNILKWHPTYNSRPVYFRTFRSPDYRLGQAMEGQGELDATLTLLAEPFAYGDYVQSTGTIYNDPAAVANGLFFEIMGAEGDVPTPLFAFIDWNVPVGNTCILAVRRHGVPVLYWLQCESMTNTIDTVLGPGHTALMSGAGINFMRTDFGTTPAMTTRLIWGAAPGAGSSVDYRGTYRAFVRVRKETDTDEINIRLLYGYYPISDPEIANDSVATHATDIPHMLDLGLVSIPASPDPIYDGYSGTILPVNGLRIALQAERITGIGYLDWDYLVLVPADEELTVAYWPVTSYGIYDGPNDLVYYGDTTEVRTTKSPTVVGSIPLLQPNQTNLLVFLQNLEDNDLLYQADYTTRYWPRHLYVR